MTRAPVSRIVAAAARPLLGGWITMPAVEAVDSALAAGAEFIGIDTQHSLLSVAEAGRLSYASVRRVPTFVRVPSADSALIGQALDAGVDGVIVPMIETVADARAAVSACRYPPLGTRSFGPIRPDMPSDPAVVEGSAACFAMIETASALSNVEQIASVDGLGGLFLGLVDLAISLGVRTSGQEQVAALRSALVRVASACNQARIIAGAFLRPDQIAEASEAGYGLAIITSDRTAMLTGMRAQFSASLEAGNG